MSKIQAITPCIWFDSNAEDAANFYVSIFKDSKILDRQYYPEMKDPHPSVKPGKLAAITFEINGQPFMGLNGGTYFKPTEGTSFIIPCDTQAEVDDYYNKMSVVPESEQCGWLKDKFGVSWQVMPRDWTDIMTGPGGAAAFAALMKMKRIDIATLRAAADKKAA